ncbi:DUF899 domain-containing protein [Catellatospora vulcania]|uniref:DUF899 domain-containing protein n=1 Tax=Catellatospora vulcania TaxID=1460450 RepID=UPI0012D3D64D|nr:DUF899 domain-containing protein [Catellatospora vulcania]
MVPQVVSPQEWLAARKELRHREGELLKVRDEVNAARLQLPAVVVDKEYVFEGPAGKATLIDLFEGRSQLIVQHFMFDPAWDEGCRHCSMLSDGIGDTSHLHALDTTLAIVSRAPYSKIGPFHQRMGWQVPWYSSYGTMFNYDYHATLDESVAPVEYDYQDMDTLAAHGNWFTEGEAGGMSVFVRDGDRVLHTYSCYGDGIDVFHNTFNYLDLTPSGRPAERPWLRHHDRYRR